MIRQKLEDYLRRHRCTLLGVGPMSLNCVNAAIDLANEYDAPLMMIASRRQIDSEVFDGGYVNNWITSEFARHVIDVDKRGKVLLARDHGGPWQNDKEIQEKLSLRRAMESAKESYRADIDAVSIDERPEIVDQKSRIGDWEIDTVIGKNHKQAIVTIVERASKFSVMKKVEKKTADAVASATIELLRPYQDRVLTITADRGKEFAYHHKVTKALECDYYFAHPYSSWERGLNENTNGLLRQFFPKGTRFEEVTERAVKRAKGLLNRRPRKTLGYATPTEAFFGVSFGENFAFQG